MFSRSVLLRRGKFLAAGLGLSALLFLFGALLQGVTFGLCNENVLKGTSRETTCNAYQTIEFAIATTLLPSLAVLLSGIIVSSVRKFTIIACVAAGSQLVAYVYLFLTQ
jgi:hypothetical protein